MKKLFVVFAAMLLFVIMACSGGGSGDSGSGSSTPSTYTISGTVTLSGSALSGVAINLTGTAIASTKTDASGNYSFSGLANGTYTVMPSVSGYSPAYINVTVSGANANITGQSFTVVAGSGGTISLPQTGQTTYYAADDDGALQKGVAWPNPRFTPNSNGTVTDNLTGFVWLKNGLCYMGGNWADALSFANSLASGSCGLTDNSTAGQWRLPNINELQSLANYGQPNTGDWLNTQGFSNVQDKGGYWSSTTYAYEPGSAWIINLGAGGWPTFPYSKTNLVFALPVRSGQSGLINLPKTGQMTSYATGDDGALQKGVAWPSPRFKDNGNGTVTDNLTGLVWLKDPSCYTGTGVWTDALSFANGLASGSCGLTDDSTAGQWRLPNANELQSMVNYGQLNIADWLNSQGFSNVYNGGVMDISDYWSSTTDASYMGNALDINMFDGSVEVSWSKSGGGNYVWPVRSGAKAVTYVPKFAYAANYGDITISVYTINPATGALTAGTAVAAGTVYGPQSVTVDPSGRFVYAANSGGNNILVYTINQLTGALTAGTAVAAGAYPISVTVDPSGKFVYAANNGSNNISVYTINQTTGALTAGTAVAAGTQPQSIMVAPSGRFAYAANYGSNNISVYTINQTTGALTAGTAVAAGTQPQSITVDPSGQFVYVANSGTNNISVYTINQTTGALTAGTAVAAGAYSISVTVDPSGKFVYAANWDDNNISVYTINQSTGALTPGTAVPAGTRPQSVTVDPSGKFVYAANAGSNNIWVYTINQTTGALTTVGTPATAGTNPHSVTTSGAIQ